MVHPVYAHICMRMRIIYVECKNKENKIFTFWYKSYILILQLRSSKLTCTNSHSSCVRVQTKSFVFSKCSHVENDNNGSIRTGCRLFQADIKIHECRWSSWNCSTNCESGTGHRMQTIEIDNALGLACKVRMSTAVRCCAGTKHWNKLYCRLCNI